MNGHETRRAQPNEKATFVRKQSRGRFGTLLREYRMARNITTAELSRSAGYGHSASYRNLEHGGGTATRPTLPTIVNVADALGLTRAELNALVMAALEDRIEESGYEFC